MIEHTKDEHVHDPGNLDEGGNDGGNGHDQKTTIFVNEKPVTLDDPNQTGMSIKLAAIAQGVQIQSDFVLSIERGGGKTELIGDDQPVQVHKGERFLAIPNDDNS
ncbi:MAG TPA: multiubiquitin domain-containing protein [Xanthobacteraceae bacterium]|jgi:hypothetical protein|nr:multiubiquitin domain-containing protein [Xanthobacteraceae bacterium]